MQMYVDKLLKCVFSVLIIGCTQWCTAQTIEYSHCGYYDETLGIYWAFPFYVD